MVNSSNIFLVGPMGAGKSTIGRMLAKMLKCPFYDSDHEIVDRSGAEITWIFDVEGEEGYRKREQIVIDELSQKHGIVLATGGGAILRPENRQVLTERGTVVYLKASIKQQIERTRRDKKRPLLQTGNAEETIHKLESIRGPLYEEVADYTVTTHKPSIKTICQEIITLTRPDKSA